MGEVVTIGDCTLYHGDALAVLPTLEAGLVAAVTDPPYGISYSSGMGGKFMGDSVENDNDTEARDHALRLLSAPAAIVFGSWKKPRPHGTRCVLIWDKGPMVGMGDLSLPWRPNTEEIYVIGRGFCGHRGSSVLSFNAPSPNFTPDHLRHHPTEKPVGLMLELIGKCEATTICDPFMGSGTTGVACVRLGRKFIGIEIERKYFDIACKRIAKAYEDRSNPLWGEVAPKPVQGEFFKEGSE